MSSPGTQALLLDTLEKRLADVLPWGDAKLVLEPAGSDRDGRVDAVLLVPTPQGDKRLVMEVKARLSPAGGRAAVEQARLSADAVDADGVLILAPWLSPATRRELTAAGACWADVTGNLRLQLDDPPLLVSTQGPDRNPAPTPRGTRGLAGRRAAEVVRALAELTVPFTLSELVETIGTIDATYVSRILRGLADSGLIDRQPRGPVTRVDVVGLVERWANEYAVLDDNLARRYMLLGGPLQLLDRLKQLDPPRRRTLGVVLTGSLVAYQVAPIAEPGTAMAYTTVPDEAAAALGLVPAEKGANALLLVPANPAVLERPWKLGGIDAVSPAVAAADLLSSGGRSVDEASALLDWALRNPDRWRRPVR